MFLQDAPEVGINKMFGNIAELISQGVGLGKAIISPSSFLECCCERTKTLLAKDEAAHWASGCEIAQIFT
jgi:hypothetical protein